MNVSASQCDSGCESGWTLYLDQSSYSQTRCQKLVGSFDEDTYGGKLARFMVEDAKEDLSMVSDASSGPRHYYCEDYEECHNDEDGSFCSAPAAPEPTKKRSKNKKKIKEHAGNRRHSYHDDDTASSPVICFSKKNCNKLEASIDLLDFSQGCSSTHIKGKSTSQKKFGFWESGKAGSKDAGGFQERNWE